MIAMKKLALSLCACVALAAPLLLPSAHAESKISKVKARVAFVDVERCVGETEDGLRAKATLAKAKDRKQQQMAAWEQDLQQMQQQLQQMVAAFQASGAKQPSPQLQNLALKYQRSAQDYQLYVKSSERELAVLEDKLFRPVENKVLEIFKRIATSEGYDLLVDRKSMPVTMKPDLDLTERVIKEYNWGAPAAASAQSATPAASAAPKSSGK